MTARYVNPVPQYFDNFGDIVSSGKLYFYESGTNDTLKDIYGDINQQTAIANPVVIGASGRVPNVFFDGSAHVIFTNSDDVQEWDRDPVQSVSTSGGGFSTWSAATEYNVDEIVIASDSNLYKSLQNSNTNNDPTSSALYWEQVDFIRIWNANVTYATYDVVKASDGNLYRSLQNSNTNQSPLTQTAYWLPAVFFRLGEDVTPLGNVSSPTNIDLDTGNYFTATMTGVATLTITNPPASGDARTFAIEILGGNSFAYTLALSGGTVEWRLGAAPTPTAKDIIVVTINDGVTANASANQDYS